MSLTLSSIFVYPVKSLRGIALSDAIVQVRGLQWDRRWMLTDLQGGFITQREYPSLVMFQTEIKEESLIIRHHLDPESGIALPLNIAGDTSRVHIWKDITAGIAADARANQFFSDYLGRSCQLVFMPDNVFRKVDPVYARGNDYVSYADGYPFLLIGEASLSDLNGRLEQPVPMNRFRPNLVFTGGEPFLEDRMKQMQCGEIRFDAVKRCARCIIPAIDQDSGARGTEPVRTLSDYRKEGHKIFFGMNLCLQNHGQEGLQVAVGDMITWE